MPLELKGKYVRERLVSPRKCVRGSFRTQVVGEHRRIACREKGSGKWITQGILHPKSEIGSKFVVCPACGHEARKIVRYPTKCPKCKTMR